MRVFYVDAGLTGNVGHHANHCRYIAGELRARGIDTRVFAFAGLAPALQTELGAIPHFLSYTYRQSDYDPISGWLNDFDTAAASFEEDLSRLPRPETADLLYLSALSPAQLLAVGRWHDALPTGRRPAVVLELVTSDLELARTPRGVQVTIPDPRDKPRPTLFRFAAKRLGAGDRSRFHFVAYTKTYADVFAMLLEAPVAVVPFPYRAVTGLRNRAGAQPIAISVLGHQRLEKGYAELPEVLSLLLQSRPLLRRARPDIRVFVQAASIRDPSNSQSGQSDSPETDAALRALAANDARLSADERAFGREGWPQLLERSDLILCPSRSGDVLAAVSAVAAEAIANGIPVVAPADTEVAALLAQCGGGTLFDRFEPDAIVEATGRALDDFDRCATLAYEGALRWPQTRGPARMVDSLLRLAFEPAGAVQRAG
jgi:glycosyltransferase involved in cell wall biosynthesis